MVEPLPEMLEGLRQDSALPNLFQMSLLHYLITWTIARKQLLSGWQHQKPVERERTGKMS